MSRPVPGVVAVAFATGLAVTPFPATAQAGKPECVDGEPQILGFVVDDTTGEPLSAAFVSTSTSEWGSLTTDNGRFLLCGIRTGTHRITAERLGYRTLEVRLVAAAPPAAVRLRMDPDPILLEGLEIVTDRFERRRRATAYSVRAYGEEELAGSPYWTAADFVQSRAFVFATPCGRDMCIWSRGRRITPRVYLDEFLLIGGWSQLETLPTNQLYMIEVYRRGMQIRAYTHRFMERAAKSRLAPLPIWQ
ncbi:MAG: carboxypeptidase regulatory-like domain-containing protein [Gemmatimonadetes bacterium]|nr:carboxypeptidase regulatory-like domain-containing protein [Gemmatimonadota bacterium]